MAVHGMVLCYEGKWLCSVYGMRVNGREIICTACMVWYED